MSEILRIVTSIGDAVVRNSTEIGPKVEIEFGASWSESDVAIPPGFRIERAISIELLISARFGTPRPLIDFVLESRLAVEGSPQSGEWLESTCFEYHNRSLSLGVRDAEWLKQVRKLSTNGRISYLPNGIRLDLGELREGENLRIPLGIALANGKEHNLASWFGVDAALPNLQP